MSYLAEGRVLVAAKDTSTSVWIVERNAPRGVVLSALSLCCGEEIHWRSVEGSRTAVPRCAKCYEDLPINPGNEFPSRFDLYRLLHDDQRSTNKQLQRWVDNWTGKPGVFQVNCEW